MRTPPQPMACRIERHPGEAREGHYVLADDQLVHNRRKPAIDEYGPGPQPAQAADGSFVAEPDQRTRVAVGEFWQRVPNDTALHCPGEEYRLLVCDLSARREKSIRAVRRTRRAVAKREDVGIGCGL